VYNSFFIAKVNLATLDASTGFIPLADFSVKISVSEDGPDIGPISIEQYWPAGVRPPLNG
jgi:hypothetical protein